MTDNEIIKALERTASWVCDECKFHGEMCDGNKCEKVIADNALDLINRQRAEFEKIKNKLQYYLNINEENGVVYIPKFVVDNLVKEMTE